MIDIGSGPINQSHVLMACVMMLSSDISSLWGCFSLSLTPPVCEVVSANPDLWCRDFDTPASPVNSDSSQPSSRFEERALIDPLNFALSSPQRAFVVLLRFSWRKDVLLLFFKITPPTE